VYGFALGYEDGRDNWADVDAPAEMEALEPNDIWLLCKVGLSACEAAG